MPTGKLVSRRRLDGLRFLAIGGILFLLLAFLLGGRAAMHVQDFSGIYYPSRCLLHQSDPYNPSTMLRIYLQETGSQSLRASGLHDIQVVTSQVYLPTTFLLMVPFALLPWKAAFALWSFVSAGCFLLAVYLVWEICSVDAPRLAGVLLALFLATSATLIAVGNPSTIVIGLCVFSLWCFLRNRYAVLGTVSLAVALALKPHDVGFIWLFLLLIGGTFRKRAVQTVALLVAICVPSVLWVSHVSPHWITEIRANLAADSVRGGTNDPGPTSDNIGGIDILVNLQTVFSVVRNESSFYNLATYLVCIPLLALWLFAAVRSERTELQVWLGLASIAALSMLPIYHRQHDAKLLLLTFPACAMLWSRRGVAGWLAVTVNTAGVLLNGDMLTLLRIRMAAPLLAATGSLTHTLLTILLGRSVSLILLVTGAFYLWIYLRASLTHRRVSARTFVSSAAGSVEI